MLAKYNREELQENQVIQSMHRFNLYQDECKYNNRHLLCKNLTVEILNEKIHKKLSFFFNH